MGALFSRRQVLQRATALGLGGFVLSALPAAERFLAAVEPALAALNLADATLQAFADTLIPGRKADRTDLGNEIHPKAIAGAHAEPGAVRPTRCCSTTMPADRLRRARAPAFLAELQTRSLTRGGQFLDLPFDRRVAVLRRRPRRREPDRPRLGGRRRGRVRRLPRRRHPGERDDRHRVRLPGDGPPGHGAERVRRLLLRPQALAGADREREPAVTAMAERVDVCIVGLGLRRLDLRLPARRALPRRRPDAEHHGARARARATSTPTSASRWTSTALARSTVSSRAQGAQVVHRQRRRRRLEPLPGGLAARAERDVRAPRPPPG